MVSRVGARGFAGGARTADPRRADPLADPGASHGGPSGAAPRHGGLQAAWRQDFIIHDGGEGMSVHVFRAKELGIWQGGRPRESETEVGAVIEIEGVTGPAGYSPVIVPTRFRRVGTGPLPEPSQLSMERLISGSDVSQRVVVEGVVQRSMAVDDGKWAMRLMVEGHPCEVDFQMAEGFDPMANAGLPRPGSRVLQPGLQPALGVHPPAPARLGKRGRHRHRAATRRSVCRSAPTAQWLAAIFENA
jgi:hypothetical protein